MWGFYLSHLTQWVINLVCQVSFNYLPNRTDVGHVLALYICESLNSYLDLFWTFEDPPITFCRGHTWFLKKYFTCSADIMSLLARTEILACLFRGVEVMGPLVAVPSLQFSADVPGIGVSEGFREPKKWMCIQLCFHVKGQTKNTTGQKEPGKGKKIHFIHKMYF